MADGRKNMIERDFYPAWKKYVESHRPSHTELYELKLAKNGKPFAFKQVADYQEEGLLEALHGKFVRIMDQPYTEDGFQQNKLCDSLWIEASECYIVVIFWIPRKLKVAVMIPIKNFIELRNSWPRKSIHLKDLDAFTHVEL